MKTLYDTANGHRLELIEIRFDGLGLYQDLDDPASRIICQLEEPDIYPRFLSDRKPVDIKKPEKPKGPPPVYDMKNALKTDWMNL